MLGTLGDRLRLPAGIGVGPGDDGVVTQRQELEHASAGSEADRIFTHVAETASRVLLLAHRPL
jgi:hypothetical protein